jgi:hypothetical protein
MSRKATKLFEKMKRNPKGYRRHHFHTLYLGYGFTMTEGKNHSTFIHPDFPQLIDQIPRHNEELSPAYAKDGVKLIETLLMLEAERGEADE